MTLDAVSTTHLLLSQIRTDGGTQPRATLDFAAVDDYMDAMEAGVKFPPVTVFYDGSDYWLADGFHRCKAASQAGLEETACDIHQGTQQDAQWYSFAANKANGLRRTNEDKQRAVKAALRHPGGAGKSDREIAKHVGVAPITVGEWRKKLQPDPAIRSVQSSRTGSDGRTINTANIGRKSAIEIAAKAVEVSVSDIRRAAQVKEADPAVFEQMERAEISLEAAHRKVSAAIPATSVTETGHRAKDFTAALTQLIGDYERTHRPVKTIYIIHAIAGMRVKVIYGAAANSPRSQLKALEAAQ